MKRTDAYVIVEEIKSYLFPNSAYSEQEVEECLIRASDQVASRFSPEIFKDSKTAILLNVLFGPIGAGLLYVRKSKRFIIRLAVLGAAMLAVLIPALLKGGTVDTAVKVELFGVQFVMVISWILDTVRLSQWCRKINCEQVIALCQKYEA